MSKLDQVIEKVRQLPEQRQDEIATVVENMTAPATQFTLEQQEKIERGLAQADAGEFVLSERVESFFAKHRNA